MENLQIWLRTPLRTFKAEIAQKNKNIQPERKKKGVLIKKSVCDKIMGITFAYRYSLLPRYNGYIRNQQIWLYYAGAVISKLRKTQGKWELLGQHFIYRFPIINSRYFDM